MSEETKSCGIERTAKIGMQILAIVPVAYLLFVDHVPLRYLVFGSGSWGVGCLLKMGLYHAVIRRLEPPRFSPALIGICNGISSGLCELGAAALALAYLGHLTLEQVIAFGVGIGSFETWVVASIPNLLQGTAVEGKARQLESFVRSLPYSRRLFYEGVVPIGERVFATMIHVGTRALVYTTLLTGNILPAVGGLAVFTVVDGLVGYRFLLSTGNVSLRDLNRVYAWLFALAVVALVAGVLVVSPHTLAAT